MARPARMPRIGFAAPPAIAPPSADTPSSRTAGTTSRTSSGRGPRSAPEGAVGELGGAAGWSAEDTGERPFGGPDPVSGDAGNAMDHRAPASPHREPDPG